MRDRRWELFEYQRCGMCCTGIELPYDPKSIFEIAEFLGLTIENTIEKYYGRMSEDGKSWESEEDKRKPCPFLTTDSYGKNLVKFTLSNPMAAGFILLITLADLIVRLQELYTIN